LLSRIPFFPGPAQFVLNYSAPHNKIEAKTMTQQLAHFALPQAVILWSGNEVKKALEERSVCAFAERKFRICVDQGVPDYSIAAP
jgi:hypothetical protein